MKPGDYMKTLVSLLTLALLLTTLPILTTCATKETSQEGKGKEEIVIGLLDDLSGPLAGTVFPRTEGMADCVRYLNEEKGGILGHPLRIITIDYKMDNTLAVAGWERLKNEGIPFVMSWMSTGAPTIVASAERDHIPVLSGAGTMDQDFPKQPSFFFASGPQWAGTVYSLTEQIEKDWAKRGQPRNPRLGVDLISLGTNPKIMAKALKMDMEKRGWEYTLTYTNIAQVDASTQVLQVKNFKCDYLYLMSTTASTVAYLKELERQSFHPIIYGAAAMGSEEIWRAIGKPLAGATAIQYFVHWTDTDLPLVKTMRNINAKWHPDKTWRPGDYCRGFTDTMVIAEALQRAKKDANSQPLTGDIMKTSMETINNFDPGIGIGYVWTPTDHQGVPGSRWYKWTEEGTLIATGPWDVFDPLPGEQRSDSWWLK
jgi:branched-chain amino acid transport system substrate-binding protein